MSDALPVPTVGIVHRYTEHVLLTVSGTRQTVVYNNRSAASGLYSVVATAVDRGTSIELYASTTPRSDPVPTLPPVVHDVGVSFDHVEVSWKPATAAGPKTAIEYCVAVNVERPFQTRCAAQSYVEGDPEPTRPPDVGFGFPWERKAARRQRQRARQSRRMEAKAVARRLKNAAAVYTCIGSDTSYTYRLLLFIFNPGTQSVEAKTEVKNKSPLIIIIIFSFEVHFLTLWVWRDTGIAHSRKPS